ncbi:MAG: hypothetical protein ACQETB_11580 [Halobacteriota archaeon]
MSIYVASGLFVLVVFAVAVVVAVGRTVLDLTTGTIIGLTAGILLFVGVYFVAMAVYRAIERKERAD